MNKMDSHVPKNVYNNNNTYQQTSPKKIVKNPNPSPIKKKNDIEEEISTQNLYKTELCRSFQETGNCRYGSKCQFAHGADELRPVLRHPKYKTEVCKTFVSYGSCPYGKRCRFIHSTNVVSDDVQTSPKQQQQQNYNKYTQKAEPKNTIDSSVIEQGLTSSFQNFDYLNQSPFSHEPLNKVKNIPASEWSTQWPTNNQISQKQTIPQFSHQQQTSNSFDLSALTQALPQSNQNIFNVEPVQPIGRLSFFQDLC